MTAVWSGYTTSRATTSRASDGDMTGTIPKTAEALRRVPEISQIDRAEQFSFSRQVLLTHCDGALKLPHARHAGAGLPGGAASLALQALSSTLHEQATKKTTAHDPRLILEAEAAPLLVRATGAQLWAQPVSPRKLAVQWNVPSNVRRNCLDLLGGQNAEFVLRLYQKVGNVSGWKAAYRTLEFTVDITRRRCYINLEQPGGEYSVELGVRFGDGRYVFLARSAACGINRPAPDPQGQIIFSRREGESALALPAQFCAKVEPLILTPADADWPWRDLRAEARVRAVYTDFIVEGPRVFRRSAEFTPLPLTERQSLYEIRRHQMAEAEATTQMTVIDTTMHTPPVRRLDLPQEPVAQETRQEYQPLPNPPAVIRGEVYDPARLTRAQARRYAVLVQLCRGENLLHGGSPVRTEVAGVKNGAAEAGGKRRRIIHVRSSSALAEAIRKARLENRTDIILRGKVKPGRRVRVGGLLIETEADGSFCVACVIRDGRLHVPVEEVVAVAVE